MNKNELVTKVAGKLGVTKKDTVAAIDAFVETVIETVASGEEVSLAGFGKFTSVDVAERTGVIQMGERKGEAYTTPAHRAPKFKFATAFKDAVK